MNSQFSKTRTVFRWNLQFALILLSCTAAFMAAYADRKRRTEYLQSLRSVSMWPDWAVQPNYHRLLGQRPPHRPKTVQYPCELAANNWLNSNKTDNIITALPLCDTLHAVSWELKSISAKEADELCGLDNLPAISLRHVIDCSELTLRLSRMKGLREITFDSCNILQHDLDRLAELRQLHIIVFHHCKLTKEQILQLRSSLPQSYVVCMDWN